MNRERFAKYQFNAKCTTNTLGQIRSRYKSARKAIITAPVGLHVKLNTMENIDIGPIYIDWYRYT